MDGARRSVPEWDSEAARKIWQEQKPGNTSNKHENSSIASVRPGKAGQTGRLPDARATPYRFHLDRVIGGHRHHRHSGGDAAAEPGPGEGAGSAHQMPEQPQATGLGPADVRRRKRGPVPGADEAVLADPSAARLRQYESARLPDRPAGDGEFQRLVSGRPRA